MFNSLKYLVAKVLNMLIIKEKNSMFFEPHHNGKNEKQDIINCSGDSVLAFFNYLIKNNLCKDKTIYLVVYDKSRIKIIEEWLRDRNYNNVRLVKCFGNNKLKEMLVYTISKMKSQLWICASVEQNKKYNVSSQKLICLGYFISFKSDYYSNSYSYDYLPSNWELICSGSMLDSIIKSAAFHLPYRAFMPLGMARNDVLHHSNKEEQIKQWIIGKTGRDYEKIIIYAPTFRDYDDDSISKKRNIWGYDNNEEINAVLKRNNAIVIAKLHSWQNRNAFSFISENILVYEPNYNFTIYDIMPIADILITDYSSIGLDFLLTNKPIIYNLYDFEKYLEIRGMCIEPNKEIFAGDIVYDESDLAKSIDQCLNSQFSYQNYEHVKELMLSHQDFNSCQRIYSFLDSRRLL